MLNSKIYEKLNKIIANGYPLKNDIFMIFAKNKNFCQEFLRVILQDEELEVIENDIQKVLPTVFNKNVVLDMLCRLKDKKLVNVEIQLKYEKQHAKRVMTYASKLRVYDLNKGDNYEEANDIIIIYLTLEDIFGKGSTVYEVNMEVVSDQNEKVEKWDGGLKIYYVNTKGLTNKTINEYLKLLTDKTTTNNKYKFTTQIKESVFSKGGVVMSQEMMEVLDEVRAETRQEMMEVLDDARAEAKQEGIQQGMQQGMQQGIQQGMQQGIQQGEISAFVKFYKSGMIKVNDAANMLNISIDEFLRLAK